MFHVSEGVYMTTPGGSHCVDSAKLQAVSRMGGNSYGRVLETFDIARPNGDADTRGK